MTKFSYTSKFMRFSFVLTLCLLSVTYFTYYTIQGDRGLRNWIRLSNDIEKLEKLLKTDPFRDTQNPLKEDAEFSKKNK